MNLFAPRHSCTSRGKSLQRSVGGHGLTSGPGDLGGLQLSLLKGENWPRAGPCVGVIAAEKLGVVGKGKKPKENGKKDTTESKTGVKKIKMELEGVAALSGNGGMIFVLVIY